MSTGAAEAGIWLGAVWTWKNQERVSLGLTTSLPTMGFHPGPPLHLGSHGDNDRRTGRCPPPLNSGKRLGQHRGLSGKGLPVGIAHPPSLAGTDKQPPGRAAGRCTDLHLHMGFHPDKGVLWVGAKEGGEVRQAHRTPNPKDRSSSPVCQATAALG